MRHNPPLLEHYRVPQILFLSVWGRLGGRGGAEERRGGEQAMDKGIWTQKHPRDTQGSASPVQEFRGRGVEASR
ncbi:hypothetical protein E2C01_029007 [Portunus trituberculatus]|uniref:Uncharacterized protein n=1 Tax=Portunus trituberculatus TaxID=210409 RepID=A0A5B7EN16_PORTR|nr:hypothetical protein [Portunus trituberculatus]